MKKQLLWEMDIDIVQKSGREMANYNLYMRISMLNSPYEININLFK